MFICSRSIWGRNGSTTGPAGSNIGPDRDRIRGIADLLFVNEKPTRSNFWTWSIWNLSRAYVHNLRTETSDLGACMPFFLFTPPRGFLLSIFCYTSMWVPQLNTGSWFHLTYHLKNMSRLLFRSFGALIISSIPCFLASVFSSCPALSNLLNHVFQMGRVHRDAICGGIFRENLVSFV